MLWLLEHAQGRDSSELTHSWQRISFGISQHVEKSSRGWELPIAQRVAATLWRNLESRNASAIHLGFGPQPPLACGQEPLPGSCRFLCNWLSALPFTILYNPLQSFTILYNPLQSFTILYNPLQSFTCCPNPRNSLGEQLIIDRYVRQLCPRVSFLRLNGLVQHPWLLVAARCWACNDWRCEITQIIRVNLGTPPVNKSFSMLDWTQAWKGTLTPNR